MQTEAELIELVRDWVRIDNETRVLRKEVRDRNARKKELTKTLIEVMKENDIDCFDIKQGKLTYAKSKVKASLSKKHLITALSSYFKEKPELAREISNHILDTRGVKEVENIRRKYNKGCTE
jgi:hypothetical protein